MSVTASIALTRPTFTLSDTITPAVFNGVTLTGAAVTISGALAQDGSLAQTGTQTGNWAVAGNGSYGGTLTVTGAAALAGLTASGNTSVGGTLSVTGATTLTAVTTTGAATLASLTVSGQSTFANLVCTGATVTGDTVVSGILTVNNRVKTERLDVAGLGDGYLDVLSGIYGTDTGSGDRSWLSFHRIAARAEMQAPTMAAGTSDLRVANTAFVQAALSGRMRRIFTGDVTVSGAADAAVYVDFSAPGSTSNGVAVANLVSWTTPNTNFKSHVVRNIGGSSWRLHAIMHDGGSMTFRVTVME